MIFANIYYVWLSTVNHRHQPWSPIHKKSISGRSLALSSFPWFHTIFTPYAIQYHGVKTKVLHLHPTLPNFAAFILMKYGWSIYFLWCHIRSMKLLYLLLMMTWREKILIYNKTWKEHLHHLEEVLKILHDQYLFAKISKCEFGLIEILYIGHIIG